MDSSYGSHTWIRNPDSSSIVLRAVLHGIGTRTVAWIVLMAVLHGLGTRTEAWIVLMAVLRELGTQTAAA